MTDTATISGVQLGMIRWTKEHVVEFQDGRAVQVVDATQIKSARIAYGFRPRHPIIQLLFGIAWTLANLFFLLYFLILWSRGGRLFYTGVLSTGGTGLGIWILWDAIRFGWLLLLTTPTCKHKLTFVSPLTPEHIQAFSAAVQRQFNIIVETKS